MPKGDGSEHHAVWEGTVSLARCLPWHRVSCRSGVPGLLAVVDQTYRSRCADFSALAATPAPTGCVTNR